MGEDDVARLPRDGYGARKTNPGCRHVAPFEGMDAVNPEVPLELQVRAGSNSNLLIHEAQQGCRDATYEPSRFPVAVPYPSPHRATPAYVVVTSSDLDTSRNKASVSGLSWISRNSKVSAQGLIRVAQHDAEQKREPIHDTVVRNAVVRRVVAVQVWSIERAGRSFGPWKAQGDLALPGPLHSAIPDQRAHIRPGPRVRRRAKQPRVLNELFAEGPSVNAHDVAPVDAGPQGVIDGAPLHTERWPCLKPGAIVRAARRRRCAAPCGPVGAWRSLVAHLTGGQGVGGSNPPAPTIYLPVGGGGAHAPRCGRAGG